ncbi:kinesin-like protein KIF27 [Solea solea]|uniref:kinesin-like protein KIF27 n=1 Tax=Solea solea TaxID=90069 RepID=UPI00272C34FC|nr:kinesin-like protein KIF27 [Solea solea]
MSEVFVRVAVRIRPLLPKEKLHKHQECVQLVPGSSQVMFGSDRLFSFDHGFGPTVGQDEVYTSCVQPLVQYLVTGYNATIFCYGQTGSGKTYTLEGGSVDEDGGIIDRVAQDLFLSLEEKKKNKSSDGLEATVSVSCMELYREELRDLLEQPNVHKVFHIREDDKGNTVVMGAREMVVTSAEELLGVLQTGRALRHIASTGMNERSSRSHTIITLKVAQCCHNDNSPLKSVRTSKLCLVDLAGSERAGKTGNTGVRFQESVRINTGLLALSKVISALSEQGRTGQSQHIPYRDAKITRLLRDALGGTAHTLMVVCVSPSHHSADETLGALQFATKARHIRNSPRATCTEVKSCSVARLAELEFEVQTLRELLKEKEMEMQKERAGGRGLEEESLRLYKVLSQEAAALLADVSPSLSDSLRQRLQEWQEKLAVVNNTQQIDNKDDSQRDGDQPDHVTVLKLREELNKCQEVLNQQEQLLEQKDAELRQRRKDAEKHLQESKFNLEALEQEKKRNRLQTEQLVEQQLLNDRLRKDIMTSQSAAAGATVEAEDSEKSRKRPHSVPLIRDISGDQQPRKIHTSPPTYSLERVMAAFKVQRKRLLAELDEKDEVIRPFVRQQAESKPGVQGNSEEDGDLVKNMAFNRSLTRTWTVSQKNRNPSVQSLGLTGTEGNLARLRPSVTQRIIQDLSVNIHMKEELITELDKTDKTFQAVDRHGRTSGDDGDPGLLGELFVQNRKIRKDQYRSLQHMRQERDQLQFSLSLRRQKTDLKDLSQSEVHESSWLEQQEEQVLQRRAELLDLQEEMRSREEVVLRREACLQEKNKLQVKILRSSQALSQNLLRVSMQLKSVEEHLQSSTNGGVTTEELEKERDMLKKRKDTLDAQLKGNRVLTAEEEYHLLQLDEAVEALDGALEFKNQFIEDKQNKLLVTEPSRVCDVIRKLKELSPPEASELLVKYFNKVVCLREKEHHSRLHSEELELRVGELEAALGDMEATMQHLALEADRRFINQCKDYQRNIELVSLKLQEESSGQQQEAIPERLQHLEKELFFYKSYSRQLKQKLKALGSGAQQPDNQLSHEQEHRQTHSRQKQTNTNINAEKVQTQKHVATTHTKIYTKQTDHMIQNDSPVKRCVQQTSCPSLSSDLQAHNNTNMSEYNLIQTCTQSQGGNARMTGECGQSLAMTPVRLCRRQLRQISATDLQVSGFSTGRHKSDVDKSTESILEDSLELQRKPDNPTF